MWEDIGGFEGYYQIDEYGNIRSLDRMITGRAGRTYMIKGILMHPAIAGKGFWQLISENMELYINDTSTYWLLNNF